MRSLAFVLFLSIGSVAVHAQEVSPLVSFEFGSPLFFNRDAGVLNHLGLPQDGKSKCFSFGAGVNARWPSLVGNYGIASALQFVYSSGRFDFDSGGASVSGMDRKLLLDLRALWSSERYCVSFGPWLSSRLNANISEHDSSGNNITASDSASSPWHGGIVAGASYTFTSLPIRTEFKATYDLTVPSSVNRFGVGISLAYLLANNLISQHSETPAEPQIAHSISPRVRFLVNRSLLMRTVPLERVETHVREFRAGRAGLTSVQSIVESYHLPHLAIVAELGGGDSCILSIINDHVEVFKSEDRAVPGRGLAIDTIDLDADPAFQRALASLSIHQQHTLIAQIRSAYGNGFSEDSLVIPLVDTARLSSTIVRNQLRFVFPIVSSVELRDSLLAQLYASMELPGKNKEHVTVLQPVTSASTAKEDLLVRISNALGTAAKDAEYQIIPSSQDEITVVIDY